ncbi:MAG: ATP-dependent Clp protease proteolytic subunit [candidate division NC10 bacterium]|nr:ATP-dependent Clp protease proteolytic subunit [candidate division NC10 bacterium]
MSFGDLIWVFFIFITVQPMIRQRWLEARRLRLLTQLEAQRRSRVIALVHRQETMSLLGFPLFRYIDIQDSEEILRAVKLTGNDVPIDLVVHTPGGLVLAASQIAHALKKHPAKVTVFVPHYAMSGGTLIALAADEIVMDENAVLGPVDPQLGQEPAASILRVLEQKEKNEIDDATLIHADMAEKALRQVRQCVTWILEERVGRDRAAALAETLSQGTWTHDYPITFEEAKEMGLAVSPAMPDEIHEFMSLFPQPARQRPSVEYVPLPYRTRPGAPSRGTTSF